MVGTGVVVAAGVVAVGKGLVPISNDHILNKVRVCHFRVEF